MDTPSINQRLRQHFDGRIVRKDLTKTIKEGANVPVYVLKNSQGHPLYKRTREKKNSQGKGKRLRKAKKSSLFSIAKWGILLYNI